MSAVLSASALAVACSSSTTTPGSATGATEPATTGDPSDDDDDDADPPATTDGGAPAKPKDAGASKKDGGTAPAVDAGPKAFTKSEIQTIVNARCAPCHVGNASAGMSLATDFTTATVDVASTQLPSMKRIAPGDKEASYLFHKLAGTHLTVGGAGVRMPRTGPPYLSDVEIERIGAFIDAL